ncbi:MAG TPA: STAS domain-containing protein, partial [Gammaproteobacteria bacterium]|nr:STAS domain-containing protein [Gammaproteobacteria bacterium]
VLDGGEVQSIDTAGLQLVVALIRELGEDGVSWQWSASSDTLKSSAEQLGMSKMLSLA